MSSLRRALAVALILGVTALAQTRTYRDSAGRYALPVPSGWTATPNGATLLLTSGDAYGMLTVIEGGGADASRIAQFTDQFGRQWQGYRRLQTGPATLSGISGWVVLYTGKNPKGVEAMVKAINVSSGRDAWLLLFSAPLPDWQTKKAAMDAIEHGVSFGGGAAAPPAAQTSSSGRHELPAGFTVAAHSGAVGQALTASFTGGESARMVFRGIFQHLGPYFDTPPQLNSAVVDPKDQQIQSFFHATYQGARVKGFMSLTVSGGRGYTSVLFDREDLFARTLPTLSKQMAASLPKESAGGGGGGGGGAKPLPLQRTSLLDGSGYVGVPSGWNITGSYKGVVDITGPNGQSVSLGGFQSAFINPLPGTPASAMTGPYRPPAAALALYLDTLTQHALRNGRASLRIVEQQPVQDQNGQAAYILYDASMDGKQSRGFAYVSTKPIDNLSWLYYMSVVAAPTDRFAQDFPTMWEMWKSWSVNPAVFRERMDAALQSMREITKIIQSVNENKQRTYDNVNTAWDQVIRGVTTVEDIVTKERADVSTNSADDLLRLLNERGYQYRQVPLGELVR